MLAVPTFYAESQPRQDHRGITSLEGGYPAMIFRLLRSERSRPGHRRDERRARRTNTGDVVISVAHVDREPGLVVDRAHRGEQAVGRIDAVRVVDPHHGQPGRG